MKLLGPTYAISGKTLGKVMVALDYVGVDLTGYEDYRPGDAMGAAQALREEIELQEDKE